MLEEKVEDVTGFLKELTKIQNNKSDETELFFVDMPINLMWRNRIFLERIKRENVTF